MTMSDDQSPLQRLLDGWTYLFIAANVVELGFLLLSGGRYLTMCGANRWFGVWQMIAAGLLVAVAIWAFRLRRRHPGRAAASSAGAQPRVMDWGLSLGDSHNFAYVHRWKR